MNLLKKIIVLALVVFFLGAVSMPVYAKESSGMIELYKITEEDKYLQSAIKILMALEEDLDFTEENQSIVQNCMEAHWSGKQLDLIYADFFLVEAILKLRGSDFLIW